MTIIRWFAAFLFPICVVLATGIAQEKPHEITTETTARVPALEEFHAVIFQIWHTAWPKKDTTLLATLLPDVERGVAAVAQAQLPGILRDKRPAWDRNVEALQAIAAEYRSAVAAGDKQPLLDAAEKLHSQYEKLVRTIRPVIKELDEFHAVLYMLYHYYLPEHNQEKIRSSSGELKEKMTVLNKAALPERLRKKQESFTKARARLAASVEALASTAAGSDEKAITAAITNVHTDYQALEKVFE